MSHQQDKIHKKLNQYILGNFSGQKFYKCKYVNDLFYNKRF